MSESESIDRRSFLARSAGVLGAAAVVRPSSLLPRSGISHIADRVAPDVTKVAKPKRGGTLIVGSNGGTKDSIDPQHSSTDMDQQRNQNLYDGLVYIESNAPYRSHYALAEAIELNRSATVATVNLKKGIEFHNGKTLTADDLMFTVRRELDPTNPGSGRTGYKSIDPNTMIKLDKYTVRFPLKFPDSMFKYRIQWVLPEGYDPARPVGTGPFKYKSFTPGVESTFVRNNNFWIEGQPYLNEVKIIDFADDTSRAAALLSGEILAMDSVDPSMLPEFHGRHLETLITKSGFIEPIVMRTDVPPFNDNRVRQAMRLIVDREQMVKQAYSGYARIANDMPEPDDPAYPHLAQRKQDIPQAKALLKAAGVENLKVTLTTAPEKGGLLSSAQVFAQQAAAAGVTVTINNLTPSAFDAGFGTWPFTDGYYSGSIIGTFYASRYLPGAGLNDGSWNNPQTDAWYYAALKETNAVKRNELFGNILRYMHNNGPDVIPVFQDGVDVYSNKLTGFVPFVNGWSLNAWRYRLVSFK